MKITFTEIMALVMALLALVYSFSSNYNINRFFIMIIIAMLIWIFDEVDLIKKQLKEVK